jgi:hypothetical protein
MSIQQPKLDAVTKAATAVDKAVENLTASSAPADITALSGLIDKLKTAVNA